MAHGHLFPLTLIAGGIALFIPGPWIVSRLFHFDFTTSFLIFTAIVNIHHFILDGALWKLRDSRIASLLVHPGGKASGKAGGIAAKKAFEKANRRLQAHGIWFGRSGMPGVCGALGVCLAVVLLLWGAIDQFHFARSTDEGNLPALRQAALLDPYDSMLQARIASAEAKVGHKDEEVAALTRAVEPWESAQRRASTRVRSRHDRGRSVRAGIRALQKDARSVSARYRCPHQLRLAGGPASEIRRQPSSSCGKGFTPRLIPISPTLIFIWPRLWISEANSRSAAHEWEAFSAGRRGPAGRSAPGRSGAT